MRPLLTCIVLGLCLIVPAFGSTADTGTAVYRVLHQGGYLEDYMIDAVTEIAGSLVEAAERWPGYGVNRPYNKGLINIYLVNSDRLPEHNILESFGVELAKYSFRGNALAHEETEILFVDTVLLKSLVTAALLFGESNVDTAVAVGAIKARGIAAFRQLWDPALNPALSNAGYADRWVMLGSGALAFILAHEMGHIHLGVDDVSKRRMPMRFKSKEDRDKHWACEDLIDEKYQHQQRIEREADDFAVALIRKVLFPPGVLRAPLLRYELGARWYIVYNLAEQMIDTLYATESPNVLAAVQMRLGAEIYRELIEARPSSGKGSIQVFFPKRHPANIRRAAVSLNRLAESPYSLYHEKPPDTDKDIALFEMMLAMECSNLQGTRGP